MKACSSRFAAWHIQECTGESETTERGNRKRLVLSGTCPNPPIRRLRSIQIACKLLRAPHATREVFSRPEGEHRGEKPAAQPAAQPGDPAEASKGSRETPFVPSGMPGIPTAGGASGTASKASLGQQRAQQEAFLQQQEAQLQREEAQRREQQEAQRQREEAERQKQDVQKAFASIRGYRSVPLPNIL